MEKGSVFGCGNVEGHVGEGDGAEWHYSQAICLHFCSNHATDVGKSGVKASKWIR